MLLKIAGASFIVVVAVASVAVGQRVKDDGALARTQIAPSAPDASRQADSPPGDALSPRNANYDIDVKLDHPSRTLTGTGTIRWRHPGLAPLTSLRMHLYWNAWRNSASSWMREASLAGEVPEQPAPEDWSSIDLTSLVSVDPMAGTRTDLLPSLTFIQPDDGNPDDRTLAEVALPAALAPGGEVTLHVGWTARVPRTFSRTGVVGTFYFVAHWFPKIAVFEGATWAGRQFHANTEFFADFGRYDVRLTVPRDWVVGATGVELSRTDNSDLTTTHRYVQDDVHDFAWTASPDYVEHRQRFEHPGLPSVDMRLLMQPEHRGHEDRHFAATAAALRYYGEWYGPYPYSQLTIVDPAFQSGAGGMEYPTLFTAGMRWLSPRRSNSPEAVTVHEAGHQFWYGLVANNEFEHAWLDEGLNTFSEERVQSLAFQPNHLVLRFFGGFIPWQLQDVSLSRATDGNGLNFYRRAADRDDPSTPTFRYWPGTHAEITYFKTALWLHTLERHLGWETLRRILSTFFERWKFRHPRPEDFFEVANEVSGQDLTWFFDQAYRSSHVFDYGVERFESVADRTLGPAGGTSNSPGDGYRTIVAVRRFGEALFPVDVLTTFEDGHTIRDRWEGRDRWRLFTYLHAARAVSVQVDPERVLLLDLNYTNNSRTLKPLGGQAADKWALTWMVWLQDLMMTTAFFL
ncbi:MAG: M1 family metallopeptidase [Acidobacteriota bacterium]